MDKIILSNKAILTLVGKVTTYAIENSVLVTTPIVPFPKPLKIIFLHYMEWQSFLQPDREDSQYLNRTVNKTLLSWQEVCTQIDANAWKKLSKMVLFKDPYITCWTINQKCPLQASKQSQSQYQLYFHNCIHRAPNK